MAKAPRIVDIHRAQVGAHGHAFFFDHQDRGRGVLRQPRAPTQQQVFETALQGRVESGANQRRAVGTVQAARQQRRQAGFQARRQQQGFFQGFVDRRLRPHLELGQAPQHFVPGLLGALRVTVRAQTARCLGQYREQRCFGVGQLLRRLAQIGPTGCRHALQGAAKGRAIEVQVEYLVFGQVPLQLRGAPQLAQLARQGARMGIEQARHLHRQGAAARHYPRAGQVLPGRPHQGQRVDAGVLVEPTVFVGQQRIEVIRRDFIGRHRVTPYAVGIGKAPQRRAVLRQYHTGQIVLGQRQGPEAVGQPQQGYHHQQATQGSACNYSQIQTGKPLCF